MPGRFDIPAALFTPANEEGPRTKSIEPKDSKAFQTDQINTTFSITFRQIQKQPWRADLHMRLMACMDRQGIPHELLASSGVEGCDHETRDEKKSSEHCPTSGSFKLQPPSTAMLTE
jgi:hypothetical protein